MITYLVEWLQLMRWKKKVCGKLLLMFHKVTGALIHSLLWVYTELFLNISISCACGPSAYKGSVPYSSKNVGPLLCLPSFVFIFRAAFSCDLLILPTCNLQLLASFAVVYLTSKAYIWPLFYQSIVVHQSWIHQFSLEYLSRTFVL